MTEQPPPGGEPLTTEELEAELAEIVNETILARRIALPGDSPVKVVSDTLGVMLRAVCEHVPVELVRVCILVAFEATHSKPMNFMDVDKAKAALSAAAAERRKIEAAKRPIVLPGDMN